MATGTPRGEATFFEDFTGMDVVADKPEYGVDTDPAVQIVATAPGGVVRATMDAGQSNIGGMLFGQLQLDISGGIYVEARVRLSAIGSASERVGVWLTDLQEATLSEYPFTFTGTTVTAVADPNNAIGMFWEGNATTGSWYGLAQNADSLTADHVSAVAAGTAKAETPVADTWQTLSFDISPGATTVDFAVDGRHLYRYKSATAAVADVPLIMVWGVTEGTAAINADLDYIEYRNGRLD